MGTVCGIRRGSGRRALLSCTLRDQRNRSLRDSRTKGSTQCRARTSSFQFSPHLRGMIMLRRAEQRRLLPKGRSCAPHRGAELSRQRRESGPSREHLSLCIRRLCHRRSIRREYVADSHDQYLEGRASPKDLRVGCVMTEKGTRRTLDRKKQASMLV